VIGLYQEPGGETVTALYLPETTDSLFLRLRPSHGLLLPNRVKEGLLRYAQNVLERTVLPVASLQIGDRRGLPKPSRLLEGRLAIGGLRALLGLIR
jgi:hypothetical protein